MARLAPWIPGESEGKGSLYHVWPRGFEEKWKPRESRRKKNHLFGANPNPRKNLGFREKSSPTDLFRTVGGEFLQEEIRRPTISSFLSPDAPSTARRNPPHLRQRHHLPEKCGSIEMANSDSSDSDSDNRNEQAIIIMTAAIAATTHFNSLCQAAASAGAVVASNFFDSSDEEDPRHFRAWTGIQSTNAILNGPSTTCFDHIRMNKDCFMQLRNKINQMGSLFGTDEVSLEEQLLMFLYTISHSVKNRILQHHFNRSGQTISRYFNKVLSAILDLHDSIIIPPSLSIPLDIQNNERFFPYFKDCIGAIDGTHIPAKVPLLEQGSWRNRKGVISQNVLAACSFDLKFTYVLAGWEGSAADSRVLASALEREGKLPLPRGRFYLVDAGFSNTPHFLAPYRGVRYHLKEFQRGSIPRDKKELFNLRHSSLRNAIERAFGVLKMRFPILKCPPSHPLDTQVKIVVACCIIHNHIVNERNDVFISDLESVYNDEDVDDEDHPSSNTQSSAPMVMDESGIESSDEEMPNVQPSQSEREAWSRFRDSIADAMWEKFNPNVGIDIM